MNKLRSHLAVLVASALLLSYGCGQPPATVQQPGASSKSPGGVGQPPKDAPAAARVYSLLSAEAPPIDLESVWQAMAKDEHRDWSTGILHCKRVDDIRRELGRAKATPTPTPTPTGPGVWDTSNPRLIDFFTDIPFPTPSPTPNCENLHDNGNGNGNGNSHEKVGHGYGLCKDGAPGNNQGNYSLFAAPINQGLTAPITGRPTADGFDHNWWLTEDGKVYRYNNDGLAPTMAFQIRDTANVIVADSFKGSEITLAGYRGFICSAAGNLFIVDFNPASANYGKTTAPMPNVGVPPGVVGITPPVFIDGAYSGGATIDAYVLSNSTTAPSTAGTVNAVRLNRFVVNKSTGLITSSLARDVVPAFTGLGGFYEQYAKTPPIVFMRKLTFGTWRRHKTASPGSDRGGLYQFNLSTWISSAGAIAPTQLNANSALARPVHAPPAVEINYLNGLTPYVFQPAGNYLYFLDMVNGFLTGGTNALVLNPGDPDTGDLTALNGGGDNQQVARIDPDGGILGPPSIMWGPGADGVSGVYNVSVVNSNALWKISLPGGANPAAAEFTPAEASDMDGFFSTPNFTTYTKTTLGRTFGTVDGAGKYVANPCQGTTFWTPYYSLYLGKTMSGPDRDMIAIMDNWGGPANSTHTSAQMYNLNDGASAFDPPSLAAGFGALTPDTGDLHLTPPPVGVDAATELAGGFMTFNFGSVNNDTVEMIFNTSSNRSSATPSAALWTWSAPLK